MIKKFNNEELSSIVGGIIEFQPISEQTPNCGKIVLASNRAKVLWVEFLRWLLSVNNPLPPGVNQWSFVMAQNQFLKNWQKALFSVSGSCLIGPETKWNYELFKLFGKACDPNGARFLN